MIERTKTIGIFTVKRSDVKPWDPDSIRSGIAGSEEAVIYLSQQLATLGYDVLVFGDPPKHSAYRSLSSNPRYVDLTFNDFPRLDVAISWRMYVMAQELKKIANKVYLWPHDICCHRLPEKEIKALDGVLWLSQWQKNNWTETNPGLKKFTTIFGNGINPSQFSPIVKRENPYSCIYASNYARGLDLLLSLWPEIKKEFSQATLDIYYGREGFGILPEQKANEIIRSIDRLSSLGVTEKGMVGHEELNSAYAHTSFWTYPCTNIEVFCISALRAQFAGAIPVIISGSALSETVRHGYRSLHKDHYLAVFKRAMRDADQIQTSQRSQMREFIEKEYTWETIARKCQKTFEAYI